MVLADNRWLSEAVHRARQLPIIFDSNLRPHNRDAAVLLYRHEQALLSLEDHTAASSMRWAGAMPTRPRPSCASTSSPTATCSCYHLRKSATHPRAPDAPGPIRLA
jgi:hypothetical protein